MELQDAATHEGVGRQRVGAVRAAVDDQHGQAGAGEQHCCRRAGGAGTDDDDVVPGAFECMASLSGRRRFSRRRLRWRRARRW